MTHLETIIQTYSRPIFGYSLKRTGNRQDAEDLAQDILLEVIKSITSSSREIKDQDAYIWSIARYTLANWIRKKSVIPHQIEINGVSDMLQDLHPLPLDQVLQEDTYQKMRQEIAHLSNMQRKIIIMHYYRGLQLKEIANELSIPVGTVKWHLHNAKKEMKQGMEMTMDSKLSYDPIALEHFGHSGRPGQLGETTHFLRRTLTQNICYALYNKPMTIQELAKELGTPPMFIEDEVKYLVEYGFIQKTNSTKYQTNFIIWNHTVDQLNEYHKLYEECAAQIAPIHFEALMDVRNQIEESSLYYPDRDYNFLLWTLLPKDIHDQGNRTTVYSKQNKAMIPIRKDGGKYIATASVKNTGTMQVSFDQQLYLNCGPMIRSQGGSLYVWQINTYWSDRIIGWQDLNFKDAQLCNQFISGEMPENEQHYEDYAFLLSKDYIVKKNNRYELNVVWVDSEATGKQISKIIPDLSKLYEPIVTKLYDRLLNIAMKNQPKHIEPQVAYMMSGNAIGGNIVPYILKYLIDQNKLRIPLDHQKRTITTLMGLGSF